MARLEIHLLGSPRILLDGREFETERRKSIALLAYLAANGTAQPREHLASLLWPDYERDNALAYLRRELYEINAGLGKGWLQTDRRAAALDLTAGMSLDVRMFAERMAESRTAEDPHVQLETAVQLYGGEFLAGFYLADTEPFEDWQRQQAEYYRREYAAALERLSAIHEQRGESGPALKWAQAWLALDDLNEAAHRAIMRIYAGIGERSSAVRQYEICRRELADELGVEPQAETTALYARIIQDRFDVLVTEPVGTDLPAHGPDAGRPNVLLPVITTPFIGRRPELEQVKELLLRPENRLVTMYGPGGSGKTRLSIQAASELCERFRDGVFFVPLASVNAPAGVVTEIAKALSLSFHKEEQQPRQQLLDYLREKQLLLILDNMEQLVGGELAELLLDILTGAERVALLATTRVRLNLPGEQLFQVTGMRLPTPAKAAEWTDPEAQAGPYSAVQLFIDRARRVHPDFQLTRRNAAAIAEICSLVDGLPLGIELAASWLELLQPEDIAAEIRTSLDFLETDRPDVPERQRSVRAVFDYSWKLLNDIEKEAFLNLTVFVGPFSNEAGRQVSGASLRTLLSLANKSWLQQGEGGRFQLHLLLRHYGWELLRSDETAYALARERHAAYYAELVAGLSVRMRGAGQTEALEELSEEVDTNIRAAWEWLVDHRRWGEIVEKVAVGLLQLGMMSWRGPELIEWLRAARLRIDPSQGRMEQIAAVVIGTMEVLFEEDWSIKENRPEERIAALWRIAVEGRLADQLGLWFVFLGSLYIYRNPGLEAETQVEAALSRIKQQGDDWAYAIGIMMLSNFWGGFVSIRSEDRVREALAIFKELGSVYEQGSLLRFLGDNAMARGLPEEDVIDLYLQSQQQFAKMKNRFAAGLVNWSLANLYFSRGRPEEGFQAYRMMRRLFEELGNQRLVGMSLSWEGLWASRFSNFDHALELRLRGQELTRKHGIVVESIWNTFEIGDLYRIYGDPIRARAYFDEAREAFDRLEVFLGMAYSRRALGDLALGEGRYAAALERYEAFLDFAMKDNHTWSVIQARTRLAWAKAHLGDVAAARADIAECLERLADTRHNELVLVALLAEMRCLAAEERAEAAAALAAFIVENPLSWKEMKIHATGLLAELVEKMPLGAIEAASARHRGREVQSLVDEWTANYRAGQPGLS